jgi:signal transduction histidine kinase
VSVRTPSTRARLTIAAGFVLAVTLAVAGLGAVLALQHSLLGAVDAAARDDARDVASGYAKDPGAPIEPPTPDAAVQVVDIRGTVLSRTAGAPDRPLVPPTSTAAIVATGRLPVHSPADSYHVAVLRPADASYVVLVALPSDDVRDALAGLRRVLFIGGPALLAVLVALAYAVIGRALAPVEEMHRRQREFVADAAHELRTPLAGVLAQLELAAQDGSRPDTEAVHGELTRLSRLVDGLLALTRAEAAPAPTPEIDLDDVVLAAVGQASEISSVPVASRIQPVRVRGDATALRRVVDNLLDNACRHARTSVTVVLSADRGAASLTVADDGPGVAPADRERVFDRFTRLDPSRSRSTGGGAGLGLAIVRAIAEAHGGSVEVLDNAPGARFVLRMPAVSG